MSIFRSGDKIHDFQHGEGKIDDLLGGYVYVIFRGKKVTFEYSEAKLRLSFTPYDLIKGGFSQERPKPEIEKGTQIWVERNNWWVPAYFYSYRTPIGVWVYEYQAKYGSTEWYEKYSIENPLT